MHAWRRFGWILLTFVPAFVLIALLGRPISTRAQDPDVLKDPVALGAWLYEGHCLACHGPYEKARIASLFDDEDDLRAGIEGDGRGCQIDWGAKYGGPLRATEIRALAQYMRAWEELGTAPDLPLLPPQPTSTPTPSPLRPRLRRLAPCLSPAPRRLLSSIRAFG